jgi:serine/threonine-protein kinase
MQADPDAVADSSGYRALLAADAHRLRGDTAAAHTTFDSALTLLQGPASRLDEPGAHAVRGMALAGLGRRQEAMREVLWLERHEPADPSISWFAYSRARILARLGETGAALAVIDGLLAGPSLLSVHELRVNPEFDPIRSDPRYRAMLEKYASRRS